MAVLSVVLGGLTAVGASFHSSDSGATVGGSVGVLIGSALSVVGMALLVYLPILAVFRRLDGPWQRSIEASRDAGAHRSAEQRILPMRTALRRWLAPTWLVIAAGRLPWLLVHYPGNVDSDTITQRLQWMGLAERSNHHPWFDTMVFGWFWDLGGALGDDRIGLFVFLLLQLIATSLGFAICLVYLSRLGLPDTARWVLTVVAAAFPTFAMSVGVMSKDAFAGMFWLPFLVLFTEAVRTRGRVLMRPWIGGSAAILSMALVLTKRTNVYLVLICLVVLLIVAARRRILPLLAGGVVALTLTAVVWPHVVLPRLGVDLATSTDIVSIPAQQTARIVAMHGDELPVHEKTAIDAVLRYDGLGNAYVPDRSDSVKGRWNNDATTAQKLAYVRVWAAQFVRYPGTAISATIANTYEYVAPVTPMSFQNQQNLDRYIDFWDSRSLPSTPRSRIEQLVRDLDEPRALDGARTALNSAAAGFSTQNLFTTKAFFSSWLPLLFLAYGLRRRRWLHVLVAVPLFVNLAFLIAGPIALPRYIIPLLYASVFTVGLMLTPVAMDPRKTA